MPSHVYHLVDLTADGEDRFWFSFEGDAEGAFTTAASFVTLFVLEFTFDTGYSVSPPEGSPRPKADGLSCYVSSGGLGHDDSTVYAHEEGDGFHVSFRWWQESSEELALRAAAYAILAEARVRAELMHP